MTWSHLFLQRIEILLTDLQPYVTEPTAELVSVFKAIQDVMQLILTIVRNLAAKGPLAVYMSADRALKSFQEASVRLDDCLAAIHGRLPGECFLQCKRVTWHVVRQQQINEVMCCLLPYLCRIMESILAAMRKCPS